MTCVWGRAPETSHIFTSNNSWHSPMTLSLLLNSNSWFPFVYLSYHTHTPRISLPANQRNYHLRNAMSQLNGLLFSRMLSKGHSTDNPDSVYQQGTQGGLTALMVHYKSCYDVRLLTVNCQGPLFVCSRIFRWHWCTSLSRYVNSAHLSQSFFPVFSVSNSF